MRQGTGGNGKGKRNRKTALAVIMIAALVGFLTAGGGFLYYYWEYQRSRQEYTEIARIGTAPSQRTDLYGPEEGGEGTGQEYVLLEVDFAALQAVNPQVTAWLGHQLSGRAGDGQFLLSAPHGKKDVQFRGDHFHGRRLRALSHGRRESGPVRPQYEKWDDVRPAEALSGPGVL